MITDRRLTTGEVEGSGLYDELMRTSKAHIEAELQAGRINESNYAQLYLGAMQANLNAAIQYILQTDVTNKNVEILSEQLKQYQKQNELLDLQKAKLQSDIDTSQYNLLNLMPQQLNLLTNQVAQTLAQTSLVQEQTSTQQKQQVQLTAQTSLTGKQEGLVDEQVKAATYQYTTPTAGILYAQYSKHMEEVAVLTQKKITEEAQTVGNEGTVAGLIGKEMELKQNQADSFIRDAEQKSAKLYADVFQIMFSVNPDAGAGSASDPAFWGITGTDSNVIFDQLKSGVTTP